MNNQSNIVLWKTEANSLYNKGISLSNASKYFDACTTFKRASSYAEQILHLTNVPVDRDFLINCYTNLAKNYFKAFNVAGDRQLLYSSCSYYEKNVALYRQEISNKDYAMETEVYHDLLESYVQILWISFQIKNDRIYELYIRDTIKSARHLYKLSPTFDNEQYVILACIFKGDYYRGKGKNIRAFYQYYQAMKKLEKIYGELKEESIKSDLILIYNNLSQLCLLQRWYVTRIKYDNKRKALEEVKY